MAIQGEQDFRVKFSVFDILRCLYMLKLQHIEYGVGSVDADHLSMFLLRYQVVIFWMLKPPLHYGSSWKIWFQVSSKVTITICLRAYNCHAILHVALWVFEFIHVRQSIDIKWLISAVENMGDVVGSYLQVLTLSFHRAFAQLRVFTSPNDLMWLTCLEIDFVSSFKLDFVLIELQRGETAHIFLVLFIQVNVANCWLSRKVPEKFRAN